MPSLSLPRPYPDELIGSVLCRAVIHTGHPPTRLVERITGRDRSNYSFFLPSMLERLSELMRYDASKLLWEHTPFPYIVAFMAPEDVRRHEEKVLESTGKMGSLSALVQSVTAGLSAVKLCPVCTQDDVAEYGESYWHRSHSLPAAHVCLKHGRRLVLSALTPRATSRGFGIGVPQRHRGQEDQTTLDASLETRLTELSVGLLQRRNSYDINWRLAHRQRALERGFATKVGEVAAVPMVSALRETFGEDYLTARSSFVGKAGSAWPALMVRTRVTVPFAPTKHVLLQAFLEHTSPPAKGFDYKLPGKRTRDVGEFDVRVAKEVRLAALRANLKQVTTTATKLLQASKAWGAYRHDRASFPLTTAELEAFRRTDASERKAGGRDAHRRRMERRASTGHTGPVVKEAPPD